MLVSIKFYFANINYVPFQLFLVDIMILSEYCCCHSSCFGVCRIIFVFVVIDATLGKNLRAAGLIFDGFVQIETAVGKMHPVAG